MRRSKTARSEAEHDKGESIRDLVAAIATQESKVVEVDPRSSMKVTQCAFQQSSFDRLEFAICLPCQTVLRCSSWCSRMLSLVQSQFSTRNCSSYANAAYSQQQQPHQQLWKLWLWFVGPGNASARLLLACALTMSSIGHGVD
eukprot:1333353-Amphidinium_carterae.3